MFGYDEYIFVTVPPGSQVGDDWNCWDSAKREEVSCLVPLDTQSTDKMSPEDVRTLIDRTVEQAKEEIRGEVQLQLQKPVQEDDNTPGVLLTASLWAAIFGGVGTFFAHKDKIPVIKHIKVGHGPGQRRKA